MRAKLRLVETAAETQLVPVRGGRKSDAEMGRSRKHLTPAEVESLAKAARKGRHGLRDWLMITLAARHGYRASELIGLRRCDVDTKSAILHVKRLKGSDPSTHTLRADEIRALNALAKANPGNTFVFTNERGEPFARAGFQRIVERAGKRAGLDFPVHPHMLRHACGYRLANEGRDTRSIQGFLGHRNIRNVVGYTRLAADRFKDF